MEEHMLFELLKSDGYIVINRVLLRKLGCEMALVLHYLINLRQRTQDREDGWFFCTVSYMSDELNMRDKIQRRILKNLQELGLIETKRMGLPAKRFFRISTNAVLKLFDSAQNGRSTSAQNGRSTSGQNGRLNKKDISKKYNLPEKQAPQGRRSARKASSPTPSSNSLKLDDFDREMAGLLRSCMMQNEPNIFRPAGKRRAATINSVAKQFARLQELGVSKERIRLGLQYLQQAYGDTTTPTIRKVEDVCEKWSNIEKARKIHEQKTAGLSGDDDADDIVFWSKDKGWN